MSEVEKEDRGGGGQRRRQRETGKCRYRDRKTSKQTDRDSQRHTQRQGWGRKRVSPWILASSQPRRVVSGRERETETKRETEMVKGMKSEPFVDASKIQHLIRFGSNAFERKENEIGPNQSHCHRNSREEPPVAYRARKNKTKKQEQLMHG